MEGGASLVFTWCTLPQILSINDWNREKEKCIPLRFRCDGRFLLELSKKLWKAWFPNFGKCVDDLDSSEARQGGLAHC